MTKCCWCRINTTVSSVARVRPARFFVIWPRHNPEDRQPHAVCGMHLSTEVTFALRGNTLVTVEAVPA